MNWIKRRWNHIEAEPKTVQKFGFILSGILFVLGFLAFFRGHHQFWFEWPLGTLIFYLSFSGSKIVTYIYRAAMLATEPISWVLLRLSLGIFYYLILSPVGLIMRSSGKDMLDERIDRQAPSYWKKHVAKPREQYERLF